MSLLRRIVETLKPEWSNSLQPWHHFPTPAGVSSSPFHPAFGLGNQQRGQMAAGHEASAHSPGSSWPGKQSSVIRANLAYSWSGESGGLA